jgi:Ulp1 family protease
MKRKSNEVVFEKMFGDGFGYRKVDVEHFLSLKDKGWLVDEVINTYVAMTQEMAAKNVKLLNSFFHSKLQKQVPSHII